MQNNGAGPTVATLLCKNDYKYRLATKSLYVKDSNKKPANDFHRGYA